MDVGLDFVDHGDLLAVAVEGNVEWVHSAEKVFKYFDRISTETVAFVRICMVIY